MEVRLHKLIAERGVCSRRNAEKLIAEGRVEVDNIFVVEAGTKVDPQKSVIKIDGKILPPKSNTKTVMLNKPRGYLSTNKPSREKGKSVLELLPKDRRYFPVGRLDKDSCGLLILTDDGDLSYRLTHPKHNTRKTYLVEVDKPLSDSDLKKLLKGVLINDGPARALEVRKISPNAVVLVLGEGRNRQIRKMLAALNYYVLSLKRTQIGGLELENLPEGKWRELNSDDIALLFKH